MKAQRKVTLFGTDGRPAYELVVSTDEDGEILQIKNARVSMKPPTVSREEFQHAVGTLFTKPYS